MNCGIKIIDGSSKALMAVNILREYKKDMPINEIVEKIKNNEYLLDFDILEISQVNELIKLYNKLRKNGYNVYVYDFYCEQEQTLEMLLNLQRSMQT